MRNKLIGLSILVVGCFLLYSRVEASNGARGAKPSATVTYTTNTIGISSGPAVLYQVTLASGAASEYLAFFDTNTVSGVIAGSSNVNLKTRLFFSAVASNTVVNFDPPLQFNYGMFVVDSAVTGQSLITYEKGRVIQGY